MYDFPDRPVTSLDYGGRFLVPLKLAPNSPPPRASAALLINGPMGGSCVVNTH